MILPELGNLLIQVPSSKYGALPTDKKSYKDDATFGVVIGVNPEDKDNQRFMGKTVYFEQFKDSCRVEYDKQALIKVSDIMGSSEETVTIDSWSAQNQGLIDAGGKISPGGFTTEVPKSKLKE